MIKQRKKPAPVDGFHWEEWRNGQLFASGYHNGSDYRGTDATYDIATCHVALSVDAFTSMSSSWWRHD